MKNLLFLFSAILLTTFMACGSGEGSDASLLGDAALTNEMDSMCYALGASFSKSMKDSKMNLDGEQVRKGYMECKSGTSYINEQNAQEITGMIQQEFRKRGSGAPADPEGGMNIDSLAYSIGSTYFLQLKSIGLELSDEALVQGIVDNMKETGGLLDETKVRSLLDRFQGIIQKAQAEKNAAAAVENKAKGEAFMAEKAKEEGVKSTSSGLMYKVLKEGSGNSPTAADKVSVHYEGRLVDGKVFDSSIKRGKPIEFSLGGVIKGWTEGLQLMKTGAKYQFYIPSDLAYGDSGGQGIAPGETLIFDVELLEIK